jgi:hypothetical protein
LQAGFFLGGSAVSGYNVPGSVFDKELRCTFDLLDGIPSDQSEVKAGEVKRTRLNCDVDKFVFTGQGEMAIAGRVLRGLKQEISDPHVGR